MSMTEQEICEQASKNPCGCKARRIGNSFTPVGKMEWQPDPGGATIRLMTKCGRCKKVHQCITILAPEDAGILPHVSP